MWPNVKIVKFGPILLCWGPSPTVPNLLANEHEWTIRVGSGVHSWSFQSIPMHSSSVLLMRVGSTGEYESFEHVQKLCVASTNQFHSCLCPSPTVPNLLRNEDEWTIRVYVGCHSWSFQAIPIHSNSVLLIRVGLAGEYESFEHVQKLREASTNKFNSCLTHWQRVAIVFVAQFTCCNLVILTVFLLYSGCSYCILVIRTCRWDWGTCEWTRGQCEWSWNVPETVAK